MLARQSSSKEVFLQLLLYIMWDIEGNQKKKAPNLPLKSMKNHFNPV